MQGYRKTTERPQGTRYFHNMVWYIRYNIQYDVGSGKKNRHMIETQHENVNNKKGHKSICQRKTPKWRNLRSHSWCCIITTLTGNIITIWGLMPTPNGYYINGQHGWYSKRTKKRCKVMYPWQTEQGVTEVVVLRFGSIPFRVMNKNKNKTKKTRRGSTVHDSKMCSKNTTKKKKLWTIKKKKNESKTRKRFFWLLIN